MTIRTAAFGFFVLTLGGWVPAQEPPPAPTPGDERPQAGPERARRIGPGRPKPGGPDRLGPDGPPGFHIPGFGPDRPPPPRGPRWDDMPESQREAVLNFVEEHFPRMAVQLDHLQQAAPQKYDRRMNRVAGEMRRLMDIQARDPRRATALIRERQVGLEIQDLARKYRAAKDDDEKKRVRKTLRELVAKEFDNRMERRSVEVRQLESKLEELKSRLSEMESVRDKMLERRMRELLDKKSKKQADEREEDDPGLPDRPRHDESERD